MAYRRLVLWACVLFLAAEPFVVHPGGPSASRGSKERVCATCGMKDICGTICCCVEESLCGRSMVGAGEGAVLRAAGCEPGGPSFSTVTAGPDRIKPVEVRLSPHLTAKNIERSIYGGPLEGRRSPDIPPPKSS